jgi:RNase adaptor protein for sRNA GlmZ degradation
VNSFTTDRETVTKIMDTTHQNGQVMSVYSNVFNLTERIATNSYLFDYTQPHVVDLKADLSHLPKPVYFAALFPDRQDDVGMD